MVEKDDLLSPDFEHLTRRDLEKIVEKQKDLLERGKSRIGELKSNRTEEIQEGTFIRRTISHKGKKRTKLTRLKKNPEKVILCYLGNIEMFVYPYQNPDTIFCRIGKEITGLDKYEARKIMAVYNQINWALSGGIQDAVRGESNSKKAKEIKKAYDYGLTNENDRIQKVNKERKKENKLAERLRKEFVESMPVCGCGEVARMYNGYFEGKPTRLCTHCGKVYDENSGNFLYTDEDAVKEWEEKQSNNDMDVVKERKKKEKDNS